MKPATITTRLTITFAALTAVVVAPAAVALYWTVAASFRSESIEKARERALSVANSILAQLDEDILVEFEGPPIHFAGLRPSGESWAILRGDDSEEHVAGAFSHGLDARIDAIAEPVESPEGRPLRLAKVPLVRDTGLQWKDLPRPVRSAAASTDPESPFLSARRDIRKGENVIEVKTLTPDGIHELKIAKDGRIVKVSEDALPSLLEPHFAAHLPVDLRTCDHLSSAWQTCDGQLIAVFSGIASDGRTVRVAVNPLGERFLLDANGLVVGIDPASRLFVLSAVDVSQEIDRLNILVLGVGIGAPGVWIGLILIGWFVARRAMSPVARIVDATRRVRVADLSARVPVGSGDDELTSIATTINEMLERLETGYRRERQFTEDASHELRGPLAKIQADTELALSRDRDSDEYREALERIGGYARRMKQLVESLLLLARIDGEADDLAKSSFDLTELLLESISTFPDAEAARIHVELGASAEPIRAVGEPNLIGTALHNLIENALRYSPPSSSVRVRLRPNHAYVRVEVEDSGRGIPPADRERVFDRFRRLDPARTRESGGSGLGLSIVRSVALLHRTSVRIGASTSGGTLVEWELPSSTNGNEAHGVRTGAVETPR